MIFKSPQIWNLLTMPNCHEKKLFHEKRFIFKAKQLIPLLIFVWHITTGTITMCSPDAQSCVVYWSWQLFLDFCPFSFDSSRWCRQRDLSWQFYYSNSKEDRSTHIQASCTQLHHSIDMWNQLKGPTSMLCARNFSSLGNEIIKRSLKS